MSFSQEVKDELSKQLSAARHCRIAELAAILSYSAQLEKADSKYYLRLQTESIAVARKYFTLIKKTFNINMDLSIKANAGKKGNRIYIMTIQNTENVDRILQAAKLSFTNADDNISIKYMELGKPSQLVVQNACCKRAFIRGAFLSSGSMSDPKKSYHLEVVTSSQEKAEQLQEMMQTFNIDAKIIIRKKNFVIYIKEGSQIVDLLNVMEAHVALMDLENVRIIKEMRNQVNRQVNCEAANISKTVAASTKQIADILYIRDTIGFDNIGEGLEEIARLRIQHPEASLKELGTMLTPAIGKSGVNHRLRKLSMIADHIREHKEENSNDNKTNRN